MLQYSQTPAQFRTKPEWDLIGILIGGLLAIVLLPEYDYLKAGGLAVSAAALSLGLLTGTVVSGILRPASLLRAEPVLYFGMVYWILIDAIQGSYGLWGVTRDAISQTFAGIAVFAVGIWSGSLITSLLYAGEPLKRWTEVRIQFVFFIALLTFFAGILKPLLACNLDPQCIVDSFFIPYQELPWRTVKFGHFDTLLVYVGFLGYLTLPLSATLYHLEGRLTQRVLVSALLGILLLLLFTQTGSRRFVGMVVMATGLTWVLLHTHIRFSHLIRLLILSALVLVLLETMVTWRNEGLAAVFKESESEPSHGKKGLIKIDKNLYYMTHAITIVPRLHPHKPIDGFLSMIGAPIPRSIWPGKPTQGGGIPLPQLIGERKAPGFTWSCSAVCDFYLMGGMIAIGLGGFLFGVLGHLSNRLLFQRTSVPSRIIYAFALMTLFIGLRNTRDLTAIGIIVGIAWAAFYLRKLYVQRFHRQPYPAKR